MFVLKKVLAAFCLPPGLFITLLAAGVIVLFVRKKGRALRFFLIGLACLIWALSLNPVADSLVRALEKAVPSPRNPQGDVVVVLHGTGQRLGPGIALQMSLKVPLILCGFNYLKGNPAEEGRLRRSLEEDGVPPDMVLIETASRDTRENILAVRELCRVKGLRRPLVVTSAFHARRVRLTCRKLDFPALVVPVSFTVLGRAMGYTWRDALPEAESLYNTSLALSEYLGLVFYRVFY
jgi:uncharacterized SAM-binding protein YcdF (DUF218 family)